MNLPAFGKCAAIWAVVLVSVAGCPPGRHEVPMHKGDYRPDHLEPVTPGPPWHGRYRSMVRELLIVSPGDCGRVIMTPAFASESAVSVYTRDGRCFITATEATRQIWGSIAAHESEEVTRAIAILRWDKEIDLDLAQAIHAVWSDRVRKARPAESEYRGSDGEWMEFSVESTDGAELAGETWSPDSGPLRRLVDLARELGNFCADTPGRRNMTREELLRLCAALVCEGDPE